MQGFQEICTIKFISGYNYKGKLQQKNVRFRYQAPAVYLYGDCKSMADKGGGI